MSEMVERVAKAIETAFDQEGRVFDDGQAETLARAAIEAMREPTVAMMDALDDGDEDGGLENGWRKAIDEALK